MRFSISHGPCRPGYCRYTAGTHGPPRPGLSQLLAVGVGDQAPALEAGGDPRRQLARILRVLEAALLSAKNRCAIKMSEVK